MSYNQEGLEIERKFLCNIPKPSLDELIQNSVLETRYYISIDKIIGNELRITKRSKNNTFISATLDKMELIDNVNCIVRKKSRIIIAETEFDLLAKFAFDLNNLKIERLHSKYEGAEIKIYKDKFEGLIRAEFEFDSLEEASSFQIPTWVANEITNTKYGIDSELIFQERYDSNTIS